jgi:carbon-monoxide dehydrogenase medium subunit
VGSPLYIRPTGVPETVAVLAQGAEAFSVLAGGTDLLVSMRRRQVAPSAVVDITGIDELRALTFSEDGAVFLGATVTHTRVVEEARLVEGREALVDACGEVGSWQIRNVATIGGNLCNGSPAAETAAPLLVLGARVRLAGSDGNRALDLEDFYIAPGHTALRPRELLTDVMLPPLSAHAASAYVRVSPRGAMDIAVAGAAAYVEIDVENAECMACRIALTGVAPTPVRAREAEAAVVGSPIEARTTGAAGAIAGSSAVCMPIDDQRASCEYRRAVVPALVSRALLLAGARVQGRRD